MYVYSATRVPFADKGPQLPCQSLERKNAYFSEGEGRVTKRVRRLLQVRGIFADKFCMEHFLCMNRAAKREGYMTGGTGLRGCEVEPAELEGGRLRKQAMSEMHWASEPSHYLEDEADFDESIESFLARFPAGEYEFEAGTIGGSELEGVATFTHVLPALPEVIAPISETDEPPVIDPNNAVIAWEPVTETFTGSTDVEIVAYQVIVEQVEPFRNSMVNLSSTATSYTISPDFLEPGALYDFEVVAFEASGNVTISTGEFVTAP